MLEELLNYTDPDDLYNELHNALSRLDYKPADLILIDKAYNIAGQYHKSQTRHSGIPYITHPLSVALLLTNLSVDIETICAAVLHDILEDTECTEEEIHQIFGIQILNLVQGVTKLGEIKFHSKTEEQAENFRKLVLAIAKDMRVLLVKLSDRLHNMMTLESLPAPKQKRIAQETMEIFAPLANRFGLNFFKWRLEDLAFKYLDKKAYTDIYNLVSDNRHTRESYLENIQEIIHNRLQPLDANITGRVKHFYSIYNKIKRLKSKDIFDLLALRIIVNTIPECYQVLGIIHDIFSPLPGRFKDYIALSKTNGYRSLHTTVIGPNKRLVEIQIRTLEMHNIAEYGVAAHWKYKESNESVLAQSQYDLKISSFKQRLLQLQEDIPDATEYNQAVKIDFFTDEIFTFSPKGDVYPLPRGSTSIDFAYRVHTEIGNKCIGVKINGRITTLSTKLRNGDIVEILTSKSACPRMDWMNYVKSTSTKSRIRAWFRKNRRDDYIHNGRKVLEKLLGKQYYALEKDKAFHHIAADLQLQNEEDLYLRVGTGEVSNNQILGRLQNGGYLSNLENNTTDEDSKLLTDYTYAQPAQSHGQINQIKNLLHTFAKCCQPLPGEPIKGIISQGRGIIVHKTTCNNLIDVENISPQRVMDINWEGSSNTQLFLTTLDIECIDRIGMSRDVLTVFTEYSINIVSLSNLKSKNKSTGIIRIQFQISNTDNLIKIRHSLSQMKDVISIQRVNQ